MTKKKGIIAIIVVILIIISGAYYWYTKSNETKNSLVCKETKGIVTLQDIVEAALEEEQYINKDIDLIKFKL